MAGRGFPPKRFALQDPRNRRGQPLALEVPDVVDIPRLPSMPKDFRWHTLTRAWWREVWSSPMASAYLEVDISGLGRVAIIVDQFYKTLDPKLLAEIRLQEARFGLSPIDRRRLQWEIKQPRTTEPVSFADWEKRPADAGDDPRTMLRAIE